MAHQAGVIFNRQVLLGKDVSLDFAGDGTLDFGASSGVIWLSSPTMDGWGKNRVTEIKTKITGQNGVTFASRGRDVSTFIGIFYILSGYCNWTGPTRVSGALLWVRAQDALPAGRTSRTASSAPSCRRRALSAGSPTPTLRNQTAGLCPARKHAYSVPPAPS